MKIKTLLLAAACTAALAAPALSQTISLKVMGQPSSTGLIQKNYEAPFFENMAEKTGLDVSATYTPVDVTGVKDTEQLRLLKSGLFDIISLRMSQVSRDEPTILGLDLVGQNPDYATAKKAVDAFSPVVDKQLQEKFNTKLLGVWPFGPQVLFCQPDIAKLSDLSGNKVRVYFQIERGGQWMKGKSAPTFGPLGPWLVTPDTLGDPQDVDLWLDVNGERMQTGSTATMIFGVRTLVSYISQFMRLMPGDVITTGTPPGVGMGMKPPVFLKPGDIVTLGGTHLGEQRQTVRAATA